MSANLKTEAPIKSAQKKAHKLALVRPPTKASPRDVLAPYRQQAQRFIKLYFGANTPAFVRELLAEWYTQLEGLTNVFWNDRRIAEIAIPIMLRKADSMGLDVEAVDSPFMDGILMDVGLPARSAREAYASEPEPRPDYAMFERDAEALAQILNSAFIPAAIKNQLGGIVLELSDDFNEAPGVLRAQWPLAMMKYWKGDAEGSGSDEPSESEL